MSVDHVTFTDSDEPEMPAPRVLRLHGHPSTESSPRAQVSIEYCEASETVDTATFDIVATFLLDANELRAALALVLEETP